MFFYPKTTTKHTNCPTTQAESCVLKIGHDQVWFIVNSDTSSVFYAQHPCENYFTFCYFGQAFTMSYIVSA